MVPPDGTVTAVDRIELDDSISRYLISGNGAELRVLNTLERQHMADVRIRLAWLLGIFLISFVGSLLTQPSQRELFRAGSGLLIVLVASSVGFQSFFNLFHQVVFPAGGWELPSSEFLLTRIYPGNFFLGAWAFIGIASTISLFSLARFTQRNYTP